MYRDRSLIPTEAVRLVALGLLAEQARPYAELAAGARALVAALSGPSLDLIGPPIELLRLEGLVEAGDDADPLVITPAGRAALDDLLQANVRGLGADFDRLVVALKLRFLPLLGPVERAEQVALLLDTAGADRARLAALRGDLGGASPALAAWLALEVDALDRRIAWLEGTLAAAGGAPARPGGSDKPVRTDAGRRSRTPRSR